MRLFRRAVEVRETYDAFVAAYLCSELSDVPRLVFDRLEFNGKVVHLRRILRVEVRAASMNGEGK